MTRVTRAKSFLRHVMPKVNILDGSGETLVLLWIVVLEADLEVNSLGELPLLVLAVLEDSVDTLIQSVTGDLTHLCF